MASLDIFPTFVELAGAPPQSQLLDGFPIIDLLVGGGSGGEGAGRAGGAAAAGVSTERISRSGRNGSFVFYPQFPQKTKGLASGIYAARAAQWKVHWAIQGSLQSGTANIDAMCRPSQPYELLASPLVFNVEQDPGEEYPLNASDPDPAVRAEYTQALAAATAVADAHTARFEWYKGGPLLNTGPFNVKMQPCCKPGCTPFPSCCTCGNAPSTCGRSVERIRLGDAVVARGYGGNRSGRYTDLPLLYQKRLPANEP